MELFEEKDGKKTDERLHDADDAEFLQKVNDMYRTAGKADKPSEDKEQ